jgi:hypothetical protein
LMIADTFVSDQNIYIDVFSRFVSIACAVGSAV